MERKIGEIFEYNGKWYQCLESNICRCDYCDYGELGDCNKIACASGERSDDKEVHFKKLEKGGEPVTEKGKTFQKLISNDSSCKGCVFCNENNGCDKCCYMDDPCLGNEIWIKIKQRKEDMEEKKLNIKPFSLEAAKAGKPVCTRDGRKARIICFDIKDKDNPIAAAVFVGECESVYLYTDKGEYNKGKEDELDLMMLLEKKEGWVNVYKGGLLDTKSYPTKKEAFDKASLNDYVDTVKITWEE